MSRFLQSLTRDMTRTLSAVAVIALTLPLAGAYAAATTLKTLHSFCRVASCTDGSFPYGALLQDSAGNLYVTNIFGGRYNEGIVFKLVPNADKSKWLSV